MKYFAHFNGTGTSLAIEKHLFTFIRENFEAAAISAAAIPSCVAAIERERDAYTAEHKNCRSVEVQAVQNQCSGGWWISAGQVTLTLVPIKHFYMNGYHEE